MTNSADTVLSCTTQLSVSHLAVLSPTAPTFHANALQEASTVLEMVLTLAMLLLATTTDAPTLLLPPNRLLQQTRMATICKLRTLAFQQTWSAVSLAALAARSLRSERVQVPESPSQRHLTTRLASACSLLLEALQPTRKHCTCFMRTSKPRR